MRTEQPKKWEGEASSKLRNQVIDAIYYRVRSVDTVVASICLDHTPENTVSNLSMKLLFRAKGYDHKRSSVYRLGDLEQFMREAPDIDFYDMLETVCIVYGRSNYVIDRDRCQQMYDEINGFLQDNGVPLKIVNGFLMDDEEPALTEEIIEPTFKTLKGEGLDVVEKHLMESFKFLRQNENNHAIVEANIALESMLKIFLLKRGIPIKDDKYTLDRLVEEFRKSINLPAGQKEPIQRVLDLAKNPGNFRNKAGHGGIETIQYDASVVRYVIRNVASTIVLLSEIMKKEC